MTLEELEEMFEVELDPTYQEYLDMFESVPSILDLCAEVERAMNPDPIVITTNHTGPENPIGG